MFLFKKKISKKINEVLAQSLYEDYLRTCRYTGDLPLNKEEYIKKFYDKYEEED